MSDIHFINTGHAFPYPYYLAVMSAVKTQKAKVNIWLAVKPEGRYFELIKDKVNLVDYEAPNFRALAGESEHERMAHIKDYVAWSILHEHGGFCVDLDVFCLKDITSLLIGEKVIVFRDNPKGLTISNAIVGAHPGMAFIKSILDEAITKLSNQDSIEWTEVGSDLIYKYIKERPEDVIIGDFGLGGLAGGKYLWHIFDGADSLANPDARIAHLFAKENVEYLKKVDEGYIERSSSLYAKLVRQTLTKAEWDTRPWEPDTMRFIEDNRKEGRVFVGVGAHLGYYSLLAPQPKWDVEKWLTARGRHYRPMFEYLETHACSNILEIGTNYGDNAVGMIRTAAVRVQEEKICYYGFDLFEELTPQIVEKELSFVSAPTIAEARKKIKEQTKAEVVLFKGDTKSTLRVAELPQMDFIYIDGGHSVETIRSDWQYCSKLIKPGGVIFIDDYFPEMENFGCKFLVDEIDKDSYGVEVLPTVDTYPQKEGHLMSGMTKVKPRSKVVVISNNGPRPKLRFHLLGLAHTKTTKEFASCAYTQKILKMGKMLTDLGHTVIHYGAEGSDLQCTEHVVCVTNAEQEYTYEGYDWRKGQFKGDPNDYAYKKFDERAIAEINKRKQPKDILLVSMGLWQKHIAEATKVLPVEMGVGYTGVWTERRVFESYAWMHYIYGMLYPSSSACDGRNYDCVIPNYFDPEDFEYSEKKGDYYLYVGRFISRKGINIAQQVVDKIGGKLVVAGQGDFDSLGIKSKNIENVGFVDFKQRSDLMKNAKATFVPTIYLEPFGGVAVESMFCGTPALTPDWGGFCETVNHGVTGYRCRTFDDYVWAAKHVGELNPADCRKWAVDNYSLERVRLMYDEYFNKVYDLFGKGWYELHPERKELDWLKKY